MNDGREHRGLKPEKLEKLKHIIKHDYGVVLDDDETERLGLSLLKITRTALRVFDRTEANHSMTT